MGDGKEIVVTWGETYAAEMVLDVDAWHAAVVGGWWCGMGAREMILGSCEAWWTVTRVRIGVAI